MSSSKAGVLQHIFSSFFFFCPVGIFTALFYYSLLIQNKRLGLKINCGLETSKKKPPAYTHTHTNAHNAFQKKWVKYWNWIINVFKTKKIIKLVFSWNVFMGTIVFMGRKWSFYNWLQADDCFGVCLSFSGIHCSFLHLGLFNWSHRLASWCNCPLASWCNCPFICHRSSLRLAPIPPSGFGEIPSTLITSNDLFFRLLLNFMFWMGLPFAVCACRLGRYCLLSQPPLPCCLLGNAQPAFHSFAFLIQVCFLRELPASPRLF